MNISQNHNIIVAIISIERDSSWSPIVCDTNQSLLWSILTSRMPYEIRCKSDREIRKKPNTVIDCLLAKNHSILKFDFFFIHSFRMPLYATSVYIVWTETHTFIRIKGAMFIRSNMNANKLYLKPVVILLSSELRVHLFSFLAAVYFYRKSKIVIDSRSKWWHFYWRSMDVNQNKRILANWLFFSAYRIRNVEEQMCITLKNRIPSCIGNWILDS